MTTRKTLSKTSQTMKPNRLSEDGFREEGQIYRTIWENSVAGLYVVQEGKFKSVNENAAAFAGYEADDLIGKKSDSIVHPADKTMVKRQAREMLLGMRNSPHLFRIITKNGDVRWVMETVTKVIYEGKPAILGNSMDVTERVLAEASLRESERRLADIIDFLPDPTFVIDLNEKVIAWNRAMEEMTGVKAKDMLGRGDYEYALPFYNARRPMLINRSLKPDLQLKSNYQIQKKEKDLLIAEMEVFIQKKKKVSLWAKSSPLYDSKGQVIGAIETIRDITDRRGTEEALRESERRLADIIDFLPDPTYAIDLEGRLIAWNHAMEEMMGVKAKDILGKGNYEHALHFYGDRRPMLLDLVLDPGSIQEENYSFFKKQGELLIAERYIPHIKAYLWGKAGPLYDRNNKVVGAIQSLRDITEHKRAEEALRESERRLADIIDFLPDPTYAIDLEGRLIAWNRAMEEMMGVKAKDILGKGNYEHALHFYGERRPMLLDLVLDPESIKEEDYSFFKRQGELLIAERYIPHIKAYLWGKAGPLYDRNNKVVGAIQSLRDITEHKRTMEALRESERRLADIIDFLPDPTFAIDLEGRLIAWNRAMEEMTGVKARDIMGKGNYEHALPFHGERRPIMVDLVLKPDEKIEKEKYSVLNRMNDLIVAESYVPKLKAFLWGKASPLYDCKGDVVGAIETLRDVTDRKLAEEALHESERRLADIIDFLPDPTYAIDLEGRLIAWNRAMEEMMGVKAKAILGKGNYEHALYFYGERRPMLIDLVLDPDSIQEENYSFFKKEGELLIAERYIPHIKAYLWGKAGPLYDRNNNVVGAIQSIRDITDRKRAEDILRESENRYRTIFENTGSAMLIVEEDTTITLANAEFENLYGYRKDEIEGKVKWTEFIVKEDLKRLKKYHYERRIDSSSAPRQYESRIINKDKQIKDVLINTELIPGTSKSIVSLLDITERKHAEQDILKREQELKLKTQELEELNAALKVLLKRREEDKNELEEKVMTNIKQLVLPYIDRLKKGKSDHKNATNLNIIESNLKDIISPFAQKLSSKYLNLTPKELQVANLIKEGKTTKEIADYMDISKSAIDTHRYHIRKKLGIIKEKINLQSYLSSLL